ncbi:hypothetical protein [Sedimenticola hydrogenitrophicus]|uniref:hypothetical protein n=1 Tax=Sedimenticola hydrogenitrophicus TaxID=2967975 RepID=UPI0021A75CAC|nr:hypothetical protein [Sedimenticola hydrogenitrophicus]
MQPIDFIVGAFLSFLLIGVVSLALLVRQGRALCSELATRYPSLYAKFGRPNPGFFFSTRRNEYMQFVMQRRFAELDDPSLIARFEDLRQGEMRQLIFLIAGMAVLGAAAIWFEFFRARLT